MRQLLSYAVAAALVILACTAYAAQPAKKKTYTKKSTAMARKATAPRKSAPAARGGVARKGSSRKSPVRKATTWRNRQLTPTPDRYKEIQSALVAKGYLNPEDANGSWNQASIDGLKKFQSAQNLDSSGKINSLSLIALGLGPKRESPLPAKPAEPPPAKPVEQQP